jgi:hypothetical protein
MAIGMERLNTNAFQLDRNAIPGSARKLMLLTNVAKIDSPITHAGKVPDPVE